ncbi:MAG: hypothetical protein HPY69_08785 [Armatimonadetes bacterium]|nr:hypothetical protein [Armatimonadota bacterium]
MLHAPVAFLVLVVLTSTMALGAPPLYDDRFFEPVPEVVTPCLTWAKPYLPGPPKVLFITHRNAMREIIELRQRLEMDYEVFAYDGPNSFGETGIGVDASWRLIRGNSFDEQGERLRRKLKQRYDVIVLGGVYWDAMPIDCRYEILKQVKAGTGLVGSVAGGRDEYLNTIMQTAAFAWNWAVWTGAAQGIPDFLGEGEFSGSVDYSGGHTGDAAVRINCTKAVMGSREAPRAGYHPGTIKLEPGAEYVLSCWTRTEGLTSDGVVLSPYPQRPELRIGPSDDWRYSEVRFRAEGDNPTTGVYLLLYQPGTVWFDDVKLVRAGTDENLLPNPSFEYPGAAPEALADGVPWKSLAPFSQHESAQAFLRSAFQTTQFGEGRVGLTSYGVPLHQMLTPGPSGRLQDCRLDYDYYLAAAIRLVLWGAKKEPQVRVTAPQPMITTDRTGLAGDLPLFRVEMTQALMRDFTTKLVIRDRRGRVWHEAQGRLQPAVVLEVGARGARVPRGEFLADLWIKSGNRIAGFGSVGLTVTGPVGLAELKLRSQRVRQGETLSGTAICDGVVTGTRLRLTVTDFYGRKVAVRETPVSSASTAFSVPMPPMLSITGRVTAELLKGAEVLDARSEEFSVTDRYADRHDVQFVMWMDYPEDFIGPMMAEEFTRNGIDAQYGSNLGYAPYANQWWLPYSTRFTDAKTDWYQEKPTRQPGDLVRDPCLTDPAFRQKTREELTAKARAGLEFSTSDFTLGDENMFVAGDWDLCFSDTCNADFRRWAQETYGSLGALNASWGSSFTDWEQVKPRTFDECKADGNYVPWVDHRLHMESVWADIHAFSREVIRETVPQARVGYEGSDTHVGSYYAADYWKLAKAMDLNNIYYRDFLTLAWKDFVTPETLLGAGWFGGYASNRNEPFMRWFPWRALFKGSNSFWVWAGYGHPGAVMAYDVSLYPFFQSACEEIREIKVGPGKLLMGAQRQHDGIALLWSPSSVHMATATPGFPDMDGTLQSLVQLLHDVGLEARVLSYEQLAQGQLTNDEFRVLVLPAAQALSDAEVAAIRRFAEAGGTVLADLRPGVTNEHGKPRDGGALDDLFGVRQGAVFTKVVDKFTATSGATRLLLGDGEVTADGSLTVTTGAAAGQVGDAPAWISRPVGERGKAVLLNFSLRGYTAHGAQAGTDFAGWNEGAAYRSFMARLMATSGVVPPITAKPDAPLVEVSRFRQGEAEYVGIVQGLPRDPLVYTNREVPPPGPRPVTISFGRRAHLYNIRSGEYLGLTETLRTDLTPGIAHLYALLPYRVTAVSGWTPRAVRAGEALDYAFRVQGTASPEQHVLRLRVFGPDGKERPYYARNLRTGRGGRVEGTLHLAVDDPPGVWKLMARDVATGVQGTVIAVVEG